MTRPLLLDLFCCEGGAATGYHRAGFDVIGVDIDPQPNYPFPFVQADALNPPFDLRHFDAIHASPPCQAHTALRSAHIGTDYGDRHADLIPQTRDLLTASGRPWVMENVPGADTLSPSLLLCGSMFGMKVRRHRLFESSHMILGPHCDHASQTEIVGIYGHFGPKKQGGAGGCSVPEARTIMDMEWASRYGLAQAIPPAYTEHIGRQLLDHIGAVAA